MSSVNKVILLGRLGRDPEIRYAPSGAAVANLSLATSRNWKDRTSGEKKEETEWHRVVFYDKLAEVVGEYTKKGGLLYVEGRLKTRKWTDKDGVEKYTTEIIAEQMQLIGGRDDAAEPASQPASSGKPAASRPAAQGAQRQPAPAASKPAGNFDDIDDDVPF
jgi:single-strand DNA-binding protein